MPFRVIEPAAGSSRFRAVEKASPVSRRRAGVADDIAGGLATLYRSIPFADEINDGLAAYGKTGADLMRGHTSVKAGDDPITAAKATFDDFKRNYRSAQGVTNAAAADLAERRPAASNLVKGVGLAAQAAPAFFTGGASAAPSATPAVSAGLRGLMGSSARAAVAGGLSAQVGGYGGDGDLAQRAEAANEATLPAMVLGAALPGAIATAGAARRGTAKAIGGGTKTAKRMANKATGGRILDPRTEAAKRLAEALKADGLGPTEIRAGLTEWQRSGASSPALLDLAGENTRALLRAAASKPGGARNAAVAYTDQVVGDLQGNAIARTRALTPDRRPAAKVADDIRGQRRRTAEEMYPRFSSERVPVTDDLVDATDDTGKWLRGARELAAAERKPDVVAEIDRLLNDPPVARVAGNEFAPLDAADEEVRDAARRYYDEVLRPQTAPSEALGRDVGFNRRGRNKMLNFSATTDKLRASPALPDVIRRGRVVRTEAPHKDVSPDVVAFHVVEAPISLGGRRVPMQVLVRETRDGAFHYDQILKDGKGPTPYTAHTGSKAQTTVGQGAPAENMSPGDGGVNLPEDDGTISAGALDYIRRALRDAGDEAARAGRGGLGKALGDRSRDVESALMDVPGFDEARSTYRGHSQRLDALDEGGRVLNEVPDDFAATFERLPTEEGGIGARQAIEEAVGRPQEGATGVLNRIATSTNTGRNLETLFGPEEAARYRDAIGNEIDRVANARFVSPNSGSQTAPRLQDEGLIDLPPVSKTAIAKALLDKLRRGATLTDGEREALLELGTTIVRSGEDIPRIPTTPQAMRLLSPAQRARLARVLAAYGGAEMASEPAR